MSPKVAKRTSSLAVTPKAPPRTRSGAASSICLSDPAEIGVVDFDPTLDTATTHPRFLYYLASNVEGGSRSLQRTADHFGLDPSTVREQAQRGRWAERAAQLDREAIAAQLEAGMAVQQRAAVAQIALTERLTRVLEKAVASIEDMDDEHAVETIAPALEAIKSLQRIMAAQRLASGQSTSNKSVAHTVKIEPPDMSHLDGYTDEEILVLDGLERARLKRLGHG